MRKSLPLSEGWKGKMAHFDKNSNKIKVLLFAANPLTMPRLQLDEEIRLIDEKIRLTEHRDFLDLIPRLAVRTDDLLQDLNRYRPQVVHFSAHGKATGEIALVNQQGSPKFVSPQALKALFTTLKDNIRVVILNACYSHIQARAITEVIDCAVGMKSSIGDRAAILFIAAFYRAIGYGRSVQEAFDQGRVALQLEGIREEDTPELLVRAGVDPLSVVLVDPEAEATSRESQNLLQGAKRALQRTDYNSAMRSLEKALEIENNSVQPEEMAEARFLLALATLEGRRPFSQKLSVMRAVENLLNQAISCHLAFSYVLTLAAFKRDFARNGYPHFLNEAQELILRARNIAQTPKDGENFKLLMICQPNLVNDFLKT